MSASATPSSTRKTFSCGHQSTLISGAATATAAILRLTLCGVLHASICHSTAPLARAARKRRSSLPASIRSPGWIPGRECLTASVCILHRRAASLRTRGWYMRVVIGRPCLWCHEAGTADPYSSTSFVATADDRPDTNVCAASAGKITDLHGQTVKCA